MLTMGFKRLGRINELHDWTRFSSHVDGQACSEARWYVVLRNDRPGSKTQNRAA
jgi:hypothetical protein